MYLSDLLAVIRRHWVIAVAAFMVWMVIGVVMVTVPTARYRATSTVAVQPGSGTTDLVNTAAYQVPIIDRKIGSPGFHDDVRATIQGPARDEGVSISATSTLGTGLIDISVTSDDASAVAVWANAVSDLLAARPDTSGLVLVGISDATTPENPYSPQVMPIAVGTLGLGVLSAVLSAVVVARVRRALDVAEEIQRRFEVTVLGRVPALAILRSEKPGQGLMEALKRDPEVIEAFTALSTNIELALMDVPAGASVLAVLSGTDREGKSTVAAGVAVTMAMSGHEILAIDADLRQPKLHIRLEQPFEGGIVHGGDTPITELVRSTGIPNLSFLCAGVPNRHPADLLSSSLPLTLDYARQRELRVIVDCPPLNGVAETAMVASMAGNVIVVVDPRRTDVPEFEALLIRLRANGVRVIGVVLNRVGRPRRWGQSSYAQLMPPTPAVLSQRALRAKTQAGQPAR